MPSANKNLVSVHKLARDNNAFLEFHLNFFLIKDQATKAILHKGRCRGGLYPIALSRPEVELRKEAFGVTKPSLSRWHNRLGHPAFSIVDQILSDNNLPFVSDENNKSVCDSCQLAKSHQLPYSRSNKIATAPLELISSDVWARLQHQWVDTPTMLVLLMIIVGILGYIFLKRNLMFSKFFGTFRTWLSENLAGKSMLCKPTGEASMKSLVPSFSVLG